MKRTQIGYMVSLLFLLLASLLTENAFFPALFLFGICFLPILKLLMVLEARSIQLTLQAPASVLLGQKIPYSFQVTGSPHLVAAGTLELTVTIKHAMTGRSETKHLVLSLQQMPNQYAYPMEASLCGNLEYRIEELRLAELFGLCSVALTAPQMKVTTIFPTPQMLEIVARHRSRGLDTGGEKVRNLRGNDKSEVYSLKEYQPGDDIRAIHWKMSSKLDRPVLREASSAIHYQTLVLFDVAGGDQKHPLEPAVQNAAVRLTAALCHQLTDENIGYDLVLPVNASLAHFPVTNQAEFFEVLEGWMNLPLANVRSEGLSHFLTEQYELPYTRMFYITDGACPEEVTQLRDTLEVTAICLNPEAEEISNTLRRHCSILSLPIDEAKASALQLQF